MSALNTIPIDKLVRLIGTAGGPIIIDVRTDEDFAADPRLIPGAVRRAVDDIAQWAPAYSGQNVIVACRAGHRLSQGAAAWLRQAGADAEALDGGVAAWAKAGHPMVLQSALPRSLDQSLEEDRPRALSGTLGCRGDSGGVHPGCRDDQCGDGSSASGLAQASR